ncbi:aspartyl/asparaginyl beta-hydroxylase domain-containing protein [Anabaena sp. UHCC 0451]|uniref:aspartyl/asparaginyl beta-hydroxylase domain-containing protein n=1 Tax=Anabaena sp. UHCC 0451 TaxID=2055235 RepID=UPI002B206A98|nr:aspartyl/asparaginyl beta-hydroxylase domain-containing protein [Anabaena sp. UHCC 0451]MEA5577331.1 aspartyl/asparaginyl beta-hydroxylase domain-containing protein [Anabaena sp. UHCC 0451]
MSPELFLSELVKGNHHKGGLKCLKLFDVNHNFFDNLQQEITALIKANQPSDVKDKEHLSNWSNPYGDVMQFSLLNRSGKFDDTSSDHDLTVAGKLFHHREKYPTIARFIDVFPHAYNMRIMGLGQKGGLSPHEEHIVIAHQKRGLKSYYSLRARFHLPIITNDQAELLIENQIYHFTTGSIFFFNNGCIHSAYNRGTEPRYHLIWDMLLTQETFELMFSDEYHPLPDFLTKLIGQDRILVTRRQENIKEYQIMGRGKELYDLLKLNIFGIKPYIFQNLWNEWTYLKHHKFGKIEFFKI